MRRREHCSFWFLVSYILSDGSDDPPAAAATHQPRDCRPPRRVAPCLTENWVPGGGYPEPSEPEPSRSNSRNRGYLYCTLGTRVPVNCSMRSPPDWGTRCFLHTLQQLYPQTLASRPCRLTTENREYPFVRSRNTLHTRYPYQRK